MRRIWRLFDGTGLITAAGAAFLALGILFAGLILSSPNGWKWFGAQQIHGQEYMGVVSYTYHGRLYDFDDTASVRTGPRLVWINPSDPSQAALQVGVAEVSDSLFVALPVVFGGGLAATGFLRRHRRTRRGRAPGADRSVGFGNGIDSEAIARIVGERRPSHP